MLGRSPENLGLHWYLQFASGMEQTVVLLFHLMELSVIEGVGLQQAAELLVPEIYQPMMLLG